jgi:membrane-associated protease RseP (regulator of RpoE activity)
MIDELLTLFGAFALANAAFVALTVLASILCRMPIEEISLFMGPDVFKFRLRGVLVKIAVIPIGGYVKHRDNEDMVRGRYNLAARLFVTLAGPTATLGLAALLLGQERALESTLNGFRQLLEGAWSPLEVGQHYVARLLGSPFLTATGTLSAKMTAFNLLPIPLLSGGTALLSILLWRRDGRKAHAIASWIGLLFALPFMVCWAIALFAFLF